MPGGCLLRLTGAGEWYSVLHGAGVGVYGDAAPSPSVNVHLSNFEVTERVDSADLNGIGGAMGGGSTIDNLWIQHTKVGMWFTGPFDGLTVSGVRIQDTTADGINFDGGVTHATVRNTYARNTGEDGLALWSSGTADSRDSFSHDTVVLPILANNFAIYGGHDNSITSDYATDAIPQGGGIQVGNRFAAVPLAGTTTMSHVAATGVGLDGMMACAYGITLIQGAGKPGHLLAGGHRLRRPHAAAGAGRPGRPDRP